MVFTTAKQDFHTKAEENIAFALTATDYKDPPTCAKITDGGGEIGRQLYCYCPTAYTA